MTSAAVSAVDDELHPARPGDPTWAETCWFAAQVPERRIALWVYTLFRTNLGVASHAVYVWGPGTGELWRQPYYRQYWHLPIPDGFRLTDGTLPNGTTYRAAEPLRRYQLSYRDGDALTLDLEFTALHQPHELGVTGDRGHLDQLGRVRGSLVLAGEHIRLDCVEMRDRSWSPRRESRDRTWLSYSYGAVDDTRAFHCATRAREDLSVESLGGFRLADGVMRDLAATRRRVERDEAGRPRRIFLTVTGSAGGDAEIEGTVESLIALHTSPYFVFVSQVRWRLPDGSEAWGEDQDTWSPGLFRALLSELIAGRR